MSNHLKPTLKMKKAMVSVEVPGPPPVSVTTWSNILRAKIVFRTAVTKRTPFICGRTIPKMIRRFDAPSIRAASSVSRGMEASPPRHMNVM